MDASKSAAWLLAWAVLLGGCGTRKTPEYWMNKLKEPDAGERSKAALALGRFGPRAKEAVPALVNELKEGDALGRWSAAVALGQMRDAAKDAIPALKDGLNDSDAEVREAAAQALEKIQGTTSSGGTQ